MTFVANARMYAVTPQVAAAWRELFLWVGQRAGVDLNWIDHAYPAPLGELWSRPDLGCVFMCGFPFARSATPPKLIAAPVPSPARYGSKPVYFTDFVVRATADFRTLEDTFGGRIGYTVEDSQSGFNAPRHHLLRFRSTLRPALYRESIGPLVTPRRVIEAVLEDRIDVGPLDSYVHDLLKKHDPDLISRLRTIATTAATPIPPLVAAPGCDDAVAARLRHALVESGRRPELAKLRDALLLKGFAAVEPGAYAVTIEREQAAIDAGYLQPA
ncbi:MAG TPA: PhnD/SsuA/transferrin family substrate-binding protein [Alphaproteobacteria bacterium]|nr:PhnD/SsuA/transferrin family substrate-binding protein [Alphaproteobacteria bacterium]